MAHKWTNRLRRLLSGGNLDGEDGQGLAYVLITGVVLLVFLIALVDVLTKEMKWVGGTKRRMEAVQGADAAVQRALYELQIGTNWDRVPLANYNKDFTYADIPNIRYTIQVQEGNWTPYSPALGPMTSYTPTGKKTERTITIFVSYSRTGERKKLQAIAIKSSMNSALYTEGVLSLGGSADVYWGPVVSYDTGPNSIDLSGQPKCQVPSYPIYISAGSILLGGADALTACPGTTSSDAYAGQTVEVKQDLGDPPDPEVDAAKALALGDDKTKNNSAGRQYYFSGQSSWSFTSMAKAPFPDTMDADTCIFFDTSNGQPYVSLATNGTTVTISGGSNCGIGKFYIMGDLEMKGTESCAGTAPIPVDCQKLGGPCSPDPYTLPGYFWEGFIYAANQVKANGTKHVYGTVAAVNGVGGGNFGVWFKSNNRSLGFLGQSVFVKYWRERKPETWDTFP